MKPLDAEVQHVIDLQSLSERVEKEWRELHPAKLYAQPPKPQPQTALTSDQDQPKEEKTYLTVKEASEKYPFDQKWFRRRTKGNLPFIIKPSPRKVLIDEAKFLGWLETRKP